MLQSMWREMEKKTWSHLDQTKELKSKVFKDKPKTKVYMAKLKRRGGLKATHHPIEGC